MIITIRPFMNSDRDRLIEICCRTTAFDNADLGIILELADSYLKSETQSDYICIAAVDPQNQMVGFLCYGPTPLTEGTYDLYWVVVDPDCSREGVGQALITHFEQAVTERGGRLIVIETSSTPAYQAARLFYEKHGYSLPEVIKNFYKPGEDRLTFVKEL